MIISFFKNGEYAVGLDYTGYSELVYQEDVSDFNPETQVAELEEKDGKFLIKFSKSQKIETRDEKFARVYQKLLALPIINKNTDKAILEGVVFSNKQIGDFIVDYVFDGNPHEQMSIFAKTIAGNKDPQFLEWVNSKTNKTNDVLTFFNMAGL